jgi:hypothetical protein
MPTCLPMKVRNMASPSASTTRANAPTSRSVDVELVDRGTATPVGSFVSFAMNAVSDDRKAAARRAAAARFRFSFAACCAAGGFATGAWAGTVAGVVVPCVGGVTLAGADDPEEAEDGPLYCDEAGAGCALGTGSGVRGREDVPEGGSGLGRSARASTAHSRATDSATTTVKNLTVLTSLLAPP